MSILCLAEAADAPAISTNEDFEEEIRAHLAIAADERIAEGADPRDRPLRGAEGLRQRHADDRSGPPGLDAGLARGRCAICRATCAMRSARWRRTPAFSLTVVGVLTLGIGLNAAVFTMLKGIALSAARRRRRLGPARTSSTRETSTGRALALSYPDYQHLRDHTRAFSGLFGSALATVTLGRGRGARPVSGSWSPATTSRCSACAPSAAGRSCRPTRSPPAAIRSW